MSELFKQALERIADPRNTHFSGDAQVVAREALAKQDRKYWCSETETLCNKCKDVCEAKQEQGVPMAGQGAALYQQMIEAIQKLLAASKEPSRWGAVGPDAEDIAWGQVTALLTHICVGIDSPPIKQEQGEPVAWMMHNSSGDEISITESNLRHRQPTFVQELWKNATPLYTTPQQPKPLTDEQIGDIAALFYPRWQGHEGFARAIEAAHGIKGEA